jgi:hypothetical protein
MTTIQNILFPVDFSPSALLWPPTMADNRLEAIRWMPAPAQQDALMVYSLI